jgi:hypothetical protein
MVSSNSREDLSKYTASSVKERRLKCTFGDIGRGFAGGTAPGEPKRGHTGEKIIVVEDDGDVRDYIV